MALFHHCLLHFSSCTHWHIMVYVTQSILTGPVNDLVSAHWLLGYLITFIQRTVPFFKSERCAWENSYCVTYKRL